MEQLTDKDGLAHHEQAVSTGWVQFRPWRTCLEPFRHLLAIHLLLWGESVGKGAASRRYIVPSGKG